MARRWINRHPGRAERLFLGLLPFLILILVYATGSAMRLEVNPNDKLLPSFASLGNAIARVAFSTDPRTGVVLLWADTAASLERLVLGLVIATALSLVIGVVNGVLPYVRAGLSPMVAIVSMIPPMALLPVLFIVFGLDELSKVVLIVIGIAPFLMRDLEARILEMPGEQLIKAQTLGASSWQIVLRVVLPQMLPRLIDAVRLSLGPAWLFLISAEAIAADVGLGYRIFLVRRYLAMDVILPYVVWITLLALIFDIALKRFNAWVFPWMEAGRRSA
ncbi:ABC transporter permease [Oryzibacter oryziterrae]|uniref:ABC transporter permease n=1 Tax=Oryzibacter oryziterrae TaxID=2766474 RepID=UPI001F01EB57|nr:ABC transporter permease subunit [Oryzibacter oryziterrae]